MLFTYSIDCAHGGKRELTRAEALRMLRDPRGYRWTRRQRSEQKVSIDPSIGGCELCVAQDFCPNLFITKA